MNWTRIFKKYRVNFLYNKQKSIDIDQHVQHLSNVCRVVNFLNIIDNLLKKIEQSSDHVMFRFD